MTPHTPQGWKERFSGQFLDGEKIVYGRTMIAVNEDLIDFIATEIRLAEERGIKLGIELA